MSKGRLLAVRASPALSPNTAQGTDSITPNSARMADHQVSFTVPEDLFAEAVARLRAAGVDKPEDLLDAALQASAVDALETVGGVGAVPTALSDVRAARLLQLTTLRNEILPD